MKIPFSIFTAYLSLGNTNFNLSTNVSRVFEGSVIDRINNTTYYYLKTEEAYNVSSLLNLINDSTETYISEKRSYYKIHFKTLFQQLSGKLFLANKNYYLTNGDYFIFASETTELNNIYNNLNKENLLKNNSNFLDYKSKQFAKYGLNYYSLIISENDSMDRILSYQLRGEQDFIITNLNIIKTNKLSKKTIEEQDTIEKTINSITDTLEEIQEITYTLNEAETFRDATIKLKVELETNGYDYNKVKQNHIFFIIDNGTTKLKWTNAVDIYLDKKQPKAGDYFFMKKFYN